MNDLEAGAATTDGPEHEAAHAFPWPPAPGISTLEALGRTWSWSVLRPATFFRSMSADAALGPAIAFHVLCTLGGAGADLFWRMVLPAPTPLLPGSPADPLADFLLAVPLGLIATAITALLVHFALFTLGAARRGPGATLRALLYAAGPSVFLALPVLGSLLAVAWWLVLAVIGIREAHGATTGRATAAVALVIVGLGLLLSMVVAFGIVAGLLAMGAAG